MQANKNYTGVTFSYVSCVFFHPFLSPPAAIIIIKSALETAKISASMCHDKASTKTGQPVSGANVLYSDFCTKGHREINILLNFNDYN